MDGFPQNHCRKRFGAAHVILEAAAGSSDSEPTFAVSESTELALRPGSGGGGGGLFSAPYWELSAALLVFTILPYS